MIKSLILIASLAAPTAASAQQTGPILKSGFDTIIAPQDYPAAALRARQQGKVAFALAVGPNGRVTRCTIMRSSGSGVLDSAACRLITARARFVPARAADGTTRPSRYAGSYIWRLPG